jgi:L-rhamnose mutarotase
MLKFVLIQTLFAFAFTVEVQVNVDLTSTCLSDSTLTDFGFTAASMEAIDSPSYCTDVYKSPGRCITADSIKAYIEAKQNEFSEHNAAYVQIDDYYNTFFGNIGAKLSELWANITNTKTEKTWKDQMVEVTKNAEDTADKCFKSFNQVTHGVSCFLSSGIAAQKSSVSDKKVTIDATDSIQQVVTDCMDVVSAICMFFKGGEEAKLEIEQSDIQKTLCNEHNEYKKCVSEGGSADSCMTTERKEAMFNAIYSFSGNKWMPKPSVVQGISDKIIEWFDGAKEKVFSWFKPTEVDASASASTRRILEEKYSVEFNFKSDGQDLWVMGGNSGVERKNVMSLKWGIVAAMVAMFFRF